MPVRTAPRTETKAFVGAPFCKIIATTIPKDDASNASLGDPAALRRPNAAGAQPPRAVRYQINAEERSGRDLRVANTGPFAID